MKFHIKGIAVNACKTACGNPALHKRFCKENLGLLHATKTQPFLLRQSTK